MTDTSKREELIEALAAGVHEGDGWMSDAQNAQLEWDGPNRVIHFCGQGSIDVGHLAAIAEAVFEQAHTPTDDERLGLIDRATEAFARHEGAPTWQGDPKGRDAALRWHMRGFEDGLNARRTVQGEPTITIEHEGGNTVTGTPEDVLNHGHLKPGWKYRGSEPQGESTEPWMCATCGGTAHEHSLTTSTCVWTPVPTECWTKYGCDGTACDLMHREQQGEPTDAQVSAFMKTFWEYAPPPGAEARVRAALRAAAAATEMEGEGR